MFITFRFIDWVPYICIGLLSALTLSVPMNMLLKGGRFHYLFGLLLCLLSISMFISLLTFGKHLERLNKKEKGQ